mgnify:CR=1 FL=1
MGARSTHESLNSAWMKELIERGHRRGNRWNWRKQDTSLVIFEMFDPAGLKLRTRDQIQVITGSRRALGLEARVVEWLVAVLFMWCSTEWRWRFGECSGEGAVVEEELYEAA